jgi:hypothetical protein
MEPKHIKRENEKLILVAEVLKEEIDATASADQLLLLNRISRAMADRLSALISEFPYQEFLDACGID